MIKKTKIDLAKEIEWLTEENKSLKRSPQKSTQTKNIPGSEATIQAVFENAGIGILILDSNRKFLKINSMLSKILGYSENELYNMTIEQISHPDDLNNDQELFKEVAAGKRKQYEIEKKYITKSGKIIYGKLIVSSTDNEKGKTKNFIALVEDITEQKQIADKLAAEQNLFITLLKNTPDNIYFKDLNGRFTKTNLATAKKFGFNNPEELIGKSDFNIFGPSHSSQTYEDEQQIIKTGNPIIAKEERESWPDGRTTWASTTKMPLYAADGKIIGTFGITHDITQVKLNQGTIIESEQLYHSIFMGSADGIFLMTDVFLDCNQTVCDLFKCERKDIIGQSPAYFSPDTQPDGKNSLLSANEKIQSVLNGTPQRFYWQHKTKDNILFDAEVSLNSITIGGNKLIQAVVRDITKRKKSERIREALFEISEAAYTASDMFMLYKKIHEIVGTLMPTKNIYIALYDKKTDMVSFPYFVDEFDPQQAPKKFGKGLTEYVLRCGEACLVDSQKDLELRRFGEVELVGEPCAIWLGVPLKLGGKTIGVIVVQDYENEKAYGEEEMQVLTFVSEQIAQVIERKRSSDSIKKYAEELNQLNTTKDKFFSIIAHDLKNPFITILGFSDLLQTDYADLSDEERLFYIEEMKKSAEISHTLLQNLLLWSRSQTGRIEFNPQKINLQTLVDSNCALMKSTANRKQINIKCEVANELTVYSDEDMLNTVFRNLITNAIKFSNKGGEVIISSNVSDSFAEITVADFGTGMDKNIKENLFKLDSTQSVPGTDNESGTGLGLILCKEFVEKNGGKIWVESELGKGSKFFFTLPLVVG